MLTLLQLFSWASGGHWLVAPQHYALPAGPSPTTEAAKMGCILPQLPGSSRWPRDPVLANEMRTIKHKAGHRTALMSGTLTGMDFDSGARWLHLS